MFGDDEKGPTERALSPSERVHAAGPLSTEAAAKEAEVKSATLERIQKDPASKPGKPAKSGSPKAAARGTKTSKPKATKKPKKDKAPKKVTKKLDKAHDRSKAGGTPSFSFCVSMRRKLLDAVDAKAKKAGFVKGDGSPNRSAFISDALAKLLKVKVA